MKRIIVGLTASVCLGALLSASDAYAQEAATPESAPVATPRARSNFQLAGRATYAVPLGRMSGVAGDEMRETLGGQVPFTIDLGWWLTRHLLVGGMISFGVGSASGHLQEHCEQSNVGCPTTTTRLGLQVAYHFAPTGDVDPWLGYGFGVESTSFHFHKESGHDTASAYGLDFARLTAGLDVPLAKRAWIGPVFEFSAGQYIYSSAQAALDPLASGGAIHDRALHYWLGLGVKFTADL